METSIRTSAKTRFVLRKVINRNMVIMHIIIANKSRFKKLQNRKAANIVLACCYCFYLEGLSMFHKLC